ncbi:MAG: SRPBCC family protein [Planctomycetia bacterium]|nr:SRPBCC family protein [Planctomycetia bacterium]
MPALRITLDIAAEPGVLFALTQDYSQRLCWDPFLREARLLNGATAPDRGVRAWCVARSGLGMETEYVSWQPPRVAAVKMTRGPWFLASFAGSWRFETLPAGGTRVSFAYWLSAHPRWLRWLLDPILQGMFARDTARRLRALKRAAATTDLISYYSHARRSRHADRFPLD